MNTTKAKRILALVLAFLILGTALGACGRQNGDGDESGKNVRTEEGAQTDPDTAAGDGSQTETAMLEPYEFTLYYNYDWYDVSLQWGDDKVSAELQQKFNVTMNQAKPDSDPVQKMNIMAATGDLPDVIMMDRDSTYQKLISLGYLLPLDEFVDNNSSYKQVIDEATVNLSRVDGKIYGLLNWATTDEHPTGNGGWVINKKIYEQLGSPKLETTDDLYNYLKLVKESGLTVDGKSVVPIQSGAFPSLSDLINLSFGLNHFPGDMKGVIPMGNELKLHYTDPKFTESMLFLNKLWSEGLINQDYFVEKSEQIEEKLSTGRVAVYVGTDVTSTLPNYRQRVIANDPDNDYIVIEPIAAPGLDRKDIYTSPFMTLGWNVLCITNNAKNPERIFQLLDYIISEEGSRLVAYGPQGELYDEVDENGYPILKQAMSSVPEDEVKSILGNWAVLGNTLYFDFSKVADDNRKPAEQRDWIIQAQSNIVWKHSLNTSAFSNVAPDPQSEEGIALASFDDLNKKVLPKIIMAKDENACRQAIQEAIDDAYKLGFDKAEQYMTGKYQENLESMKGK